MLFEQALEEAERAVPAERLARPAIERASDIVEVFLGVHGQVGALGQELAQQAVGVLAGAALPGAMRVTEIDGHAGLSGQFGVARHLLTLVVGQAQA